MVADRNPGDGSASCQEQSNLGRETIVMQTMVLDERSAPVISAGRAKQTEFKLL